jgi:Fic family protein
VAFGAELEHLSPALWNALGEAVDKAARLARKPRLRIPLVLNPANPASSYSAREIQNLELAYRVVRGENPDQPLTPADIRRYHRLIYEGVTDVDDILLACAGKAVWPVTPGKFRTHQIQILLGHDPARSPMAPEAPPSHEVVPELIAELCRWASTPSPDSRVSMARAVLAHLYLAWIHPFTDGSGRVARILEARVLLECLPASAAHLLSNHWNANRSAYSRWIRSAVVRSGDVEPFLLSAAFGLIEQADLAARGRAPQESDATVRARGSWNIAAWLTPKPLDVEAREGEGTDGLR